MSLNLFFKSLLLGIFLCPACTQAPPAPLSPASLPAQVVLPYSLRNRAFDGQQLWQVYNENGKSFLLAQTPTGKEILKTQLQSFLPAHRSLAWGQGKIWLLDDNNTLYSLNPQGQLEKTLTLAKLPESRIAEQLTWVQDQLWLLCLSYLGPNGAIVPATLYRLDPASGDLLEQIATQDDRQLSSDFSYNFSGFSHQNLAADSQNFYVSRANLYNKSVNLLYRIERSTGLTHGDALGRIYTGISSLFFWQNQLLAIELLDTSNCGEYCKGKLTTLTLPK